MDKRKIKGGKPEGKILQSSMAAMSINWKDKLATNPDILGGKPVVKGTRVPVQVIVGSMAGGMTMEEVCKEYNIQPEQVKAALAYDLNVNWVPR